MITVQVQGYVKVILTVQSKLDSFFFFFLLFFNLDTVKCHNRCQLRSLDHSVLLLDKNQLTDW